MTSVLDAALEYASRGWPVFPCLPDRKQPATEHGCKDATTHEAIIRAWWGRQPRFNVAIATGAPGPDVLDVDVAKDADKAWEAFGKLERVRLLRGAFARVRTRSGGLHVYFVGTEQGNAAGIGGVPLDYRGRGGYALAPPSQVEGGSYELVYQRPEGGTFNLELARRFLTPPKPPRRRVVPPASGDLGTLVRYIASMSGPNGGRNDKLNWAAWRAAELVAAGKTDAGTAEAALLEAARASGYVADHSEREALATIRSGLGVSR